MNNNELFQLDLRHVWHPCTHMKDFEHRNPLLVHRAKGSMLYTHQGEIIDAISSWWCKSLGHGFPPVIDAIQAQLSKFEHIIGAGTTHEKIVLLSQKLASLSGLQHIFFASDGSSAVEIAMKLARMATVTKGDASRNEWISLNNSYHGETIATLSVSDVLDKKEFEGLGPKCHFLKPIPYVSGPDDPLWSSCSDAWEMVLPQLNALKTIVCAILVEPIVQGAAGMRCYSADFLRRLAHFAKANDIYLIADEIMTGLGRTGPWFAYQHAGIKPDLVCLSKGLTSGTLPFSCVLIDSPIYALFYDEADFLHSHTYSGHALSVAAAYATLNCMEDSAFQTQRDLMSQTMREVFQHLASKSGRITHVRSIGSIVAGELENGSTQEIGLQIHLEALKRGALLRPIGQTLYWLPPLNSTLETIEKLAQITLNSINAVYA